ncbi:hypothetical protein ACIP6P_26925 [Streptomyces sp. NPDC088729]|uniref:hypothetical protein n=1 Tax=Streptomyces sp. NPDC088729 TaxID=3365876 RepID=UPI003816222B
MLLVSDFPKWCDRKRLYGPLAAWESLQGHATPAASSSAAYGTVLEADFSPDPPKVDLLDPDRFRITT